MSGEAETKVSVKQNLVSAETKMKKDELVSGVTSFGRNLVSGVSGKVSGVTSFGRNLISGVSGKSFGQAKFSSAETSYPRKFCPKPQSSKI